MKHLFISLFALGVSQLGLAAADPSIDLSLLVDGSLTDPASQMVAHYMGKEKQHRLQLAEQDVGDAIGVAHVWSGTLEDRVQVDKTSVEVSVLVSKTEKKDGSIHWWAQVMFANRIAAGLGAPSLKGLRLVANGAGVW